MANHAFDTSDPAAVDRTTYFRHGCNALAKSHMVRDMVPDSAKFIFLLESPHVQELKFGAPVSGLSGASMSRHLFGEQYERIPLGLIVKKNRDEALQRPAVNRVGLMNVCNIPMQASAYGDAALVAEHATLLQVLATLRTVGGAGSYRDPDVNIVQEMLLVSFRKRLQVLRNRHVTMVPCGRFAQKFFALAAISSENWTVMGDIPHPSYNNWSKPTYAAAVSRLREAFARG